MTTPVPPAVTVATDKAAYAVGDPITVTVEYLDPANPGVTVTVTASVTALDGTASTGSATYTAGAAPALPLTVAVSDSVSTAYTQQSNVAGTAVFTGVIPALPA